MLSNTKWNRLLCSNFSWLICYGKIYVSLLIFIPLCFGRCDLATISSKGQGLDTLLVPCSDVSDHRIACLPFKSKPKWFYWRTAICKWEFSCYLKIKFLSQLLSFFSSFTFAIGHWPFANGIWRFKNSICHLPFAIGTLANGILRFKNRFCHSPFAIRH